MWALMVLSCQLAPALPKHQKDLGTAGWTDKAPQSWASRCVAQQSKFFTSCKFIYNVKDWHLSVLNVLPVLCKAPDLLICLIVSPSTHSFGRCRFHQ